MVKPPPAKVVSKMLKTKTPHPRSKLWARKRSNLGKRGAPYRQMKTPQRAHVEMNERSNGALKLMNK